MSPDDTAWLKQVEQRIDAAKCAVTSNGRLSETELAKLASDLETIKKRARALLQEGERG